MAHFRNGSSPEQRLGIYKSFSEVPTEHRLSAVERQLEERAIWGEFIQDRQSQLEEGLSDKRRVKYDRCEQRWIEYIEDEMGRHHATADPRHIENWLGQLLDSRTIGTVYDEYFSTIYLFYAWLWYHTEYPHKYSPVVMAAVEGGTTRRCWEYKIELRNGGTV